MAILKSLLRTATPVLWAGGSLFNGFLLADMTSGSTSVFYLNGKNLLRVPGVVKIPIKDGVLATDVRPFQNAQVSPVGMTYSFKWYDLHNNLRATQNTITLDADEETIVQPTLG